MTDEPIRLRELTDVKEIEKPLRPGECEAIIAPNRVFRGTPSQIAEQYRRVQEGDKK